MFESDRDRQILFGLTARLWNAGTQTPSGEPMRHRGYVWSIQFSPDGQRLLTGSTDAASWNARRAATQRAGETPSSAAFPGANLV
jgi:WD40 repeat protein